MVRRYAEDSSEILGTMVKRRASGSVCLDDREDETGGGMDVRDALEIGTGTVDREDETGGGMDEIDDLETGTGMGVLEEESADDLETGTGMGVLEEESADDLETGTGMGVLETGTGTYDSEGAVARHKFS